MACCQLPIENSLAGYKNHLPFEQEDLHLAEKVKLGFTLATEKGVLLGDKIINPHLHQETTAFRADMIGANYQQGCLPPVTTLRWLR